MNSIRDIAIPLSIALGWCAALSAQSAPDLSGLERTHKILSDLTYVTVDDHPVKLDVYASRSVERAPALIYFHGGGWTSGKRETAMPRLAPYLADGWTVVNVDYRLAGTALAPAAVEDSRCALRYVLQRAEALNIDPERVVLSGHSAGGHLALLAGITTASSGFDRHCSHATGAEPRAAAIVNWYGITDVVDLVEGKNRKNYATTWIGSQPDRKAIAQRVSPLSYISPGLPPIITVHGDLDQTVPHEQAVRLHLALTRVRVKNRLITIDGGKHGAFSDVELDQAYDAIESFLKEANVLR